MAKVHLFAKTYSGKDVPILADEYGNVGGGGAGGVGAAAHAEAGGWSYAAASGGITNTTDVTLAAAPGNLMANYLSAIQIVNKDGSVGTEVVVKSGSTILWRTWVPATSGKADAVFPRPLVAANNTALTAACVTDSSETYINAQGFIAALPNVPAQVVSQSDEIIDDFGAYVTAADGSIILNA